MFERARPWQAPALALALTLVGVLGLLAWSSALCGAPRSPLDDAYIHLGVARTLVEDGTWGLNPGEHASASSSPLWTLAIAGVFAVTGPWEHAGLLLAILSAGLLLWVGAASLRDEGLPERAVAAGLLLLVLLAPLPFLVGLGMEHVLQAALALLLARGTRSAGTGFALAFAAALTRYESAALILALAWVQRREAPARALAILGGGAAAVGGFGLYSLSQGGLFLPNSVLLKSLRGSGPWEALGAALSEGAPLLALAVGVVVAAAALETGALHRRRVGLFAACVLAQLTLGRVGWLFRYEAWLMAWGCLLLVTPARLLLARRGPMVLAAGALLLLPLGWRAAQANRLFGPGARLFSDVNVALARWVGAEWPGARVAAQDIGALAFFSDAEIVDVVGLGTDEIAAMKLEGALSKERVDALFAARGVQLAITGREWLGGETPASFQEIARIWAPFPQGAGEFETVIWCVDPAARERLAASLDPLEAELSPRARLERVRELALPLAELQLSGAAVQREPDRIAFYTAGEASFTAPISGELLLRLDGTRASGQGPTLSVERGGQVRALRVEEAGQRALGRVEAGERVLLRYADDAVDEAGGDRNLFLLGVTIRP